MRVIEGRLSRARRSRGRATSVAAFLLLATSLAAQTPEIPPGVSGEGALQNDVFTPTSPEAIRLLDAGDQAFLKARAPGANAQGTDAKAQGAGANAQGTGVKAQGAGAKAQGAGAKAQGPDAKAQGAGGPSPSAFDEALDDWHAALAVGAENDAVAIGADALRALEALFPDSDRSLARRTESVETAVVRRIATLDPSLRELWRARFEGLAGAALAAA